MNQIHHFYISKDDFREIIHWCCKMFGPVGNGRWGRSLIKDGSNRNWMIWFTNDSDAILFKMTWKLS